MFVPACLAFCMIDFDVLWHFQPCHCSGDMQANLLWLQTCNWQQTLWILENWMARFVWFGIPWTENYLRSILAILLEIQMETCGGIILRITLSTGDGFLQLLKSVIWSHFCLKISQLMLWDWGKLVAWIVLVSSSAMDRMVFLRKALDSVSGRYISEPDLYLRSISYCWICNRSLEICFGAEVRGFL